MKPGSRDEATPARGDRSPSRTGHRAAWRRRLRPFRLAWRRGSACLVRRRWWFAAALGVAFIVSWWGVRPHDAAWFEAIKGTKNSPSYRVADALGFWGDFTQFNLVLFLALWGAGAVRRSAFLKRLAACTLLGAVVAGIGARALKLSIGRPRPSVEDVADGFQGPRLKGRFHSFPSGHTAACFGSAVPALVACPVVGVPCTAFAGAVAWSRIHQHKHWPSDVAFGIALGSAAGIAFGVPLRRAARRAARLRLRRTRARPAP